MKGASSISSTRVEKLRSIEKASQELWSKEKVFEADAPSNFEKNENKYFVTFPYPYMNGLLHLGHAFSLSKSEFAAGFARMKGKHVLWPFGLHATGMPIAACAKKLENEIEKFGNPPIFPSEETVEKADSKPLSGSEIVAFKSKKGKKGPAAKPQWTILEEMKCDNISEFRDPEHWLKVFPPRALEDLKAFGARIDYRRSFITTSLNPYYDGFVRWQFDILKRGKKIAFGKRYTVFSPLDEQPCQDHDRASGEGVLPQEYTLIKLQVADPSSHPAISRFAALIGFRSVIFPAATLRPETMPGLTNCWVSPSINYSAYLVQNEIFIMTKRSARNLRYQMQGVGSDSLFEVSGQDLVGTRLLTPMGPYASVYALPMDTISESKGTAIVVSVPSDSPDDFINLQALKRKPDYRFKLGLNDEWIMNFNPVAIIQVPNSELGENSAEVACAIHQVSGPKDAEKLLAAKQMTYREGFYRGVMITGPYCGKPVSAAKMLAKKEMTESGQALAYSEPDGLVISRSGDECVVALVDQWYLRYGEESWREAVERHVAQTMECYSPAVRNGLCETLSWLGDWACSRTFGLGSRLPYAGAEKYLVDSLSDSTIYMAYYTICHLLHGEDNIDGSRPSPDYGIEASSMTNEVWNYIFFGEFEPVECGIPSSLLRRMRREFLYWYPVDLRVSGKDLIQNHLTMCLYNHAAVWPTKPELWPRAYYCNGHILVNKEKMSKSKGNFRTLKETVDQYTSDAARLALADAGDSLDDPNFVTNNLPSIISKLGQIIDFCEDFVSSRQKMRDGKRNLFDKIFDNHISHSIVECEKAYTNMQFRNVLHCMFFDLTNARDEWKLYCGAEGLHHDIARRYVEVQAKLLCPIAPHTAEHIYQNCVEVYPGKLPSIQSFGVQWPDAPKVSLALQLTQKLLQDTLCDIRGNLVKAVKKRPKINAVRIFASSCYTSWQRHALTVVSKEKGVTQGIFAVDGDVAKLYASPLKNHAETSKYVADALSFLAYVRDNSILHEVEKLYPAVNDYATLLEQRGFLEEFTSVSHIDIVDRDVVENDNVHFATAQKCRTSKPSICFFEN